MKENKEKQKESIVDFIQQKIDEGIIQGWSEEHLCQSCVTFIPMQKKEQKSKLKRVN